MLRSLERGLVLAEESVLVALLLFMVLMSFLQVVLRVFFSTGLIWADTLLRHLVLWVGFLGAGLAASSGKQFAMDAMDRVLQGQAKRFAHALCHTFAMVVCLMLLSAACAFFKEEYAHSQPAFEVLGRGVPGWTLEVILPLGFALLAAHYALRLALVFSSRE